MPPMGARARRGRQTGRQIAVQDNDEAENTVSKVPFRWRTVALAMAAAVLAVALSIRSNAAADDNDAHGSNFGPLPDGAGRVKSVEWSPERPFAKQVTAALEPLVLRRTVVDTWPARRKWDADYVADRVPLLSGVYSSKSPVFGPFFDEARPLAKVEEVKPAANYSKTATRTGSSILLWDKRGGGERSEFLYYTGSLESLGPSLGRDVAPLDELISVNPQKTSVNAWLGQRGVVAPCHYDGYHNFYAQLVGYKRFVLFRPTEWRRTAPYPFLHPSHAQCQIDVDVLTNNGISRSSAARTGDLLPPPDALAAYALVADLHPGDVLYLPPLWFHHVVAESESVSVNAWLGPDEEVDAEEMIKLPTPFALPVSASRRAGLTNGQLSEMASLLLLVPRSVFGHSSTLLHDTVSVRYGTLVDRGVLDFADFSLDCHVILQQSSMAAVAAYLDTVRIAAMRLPSDTRELWVGNMLEYLAASMVGTKQAGGLMHAVAGLECA